MRLFRAPNNILHLAIMMTLTALCFTMTSLTWLHVNAFTSTHRYQLNSIPDRYRRIHSYSSNSSKSTTSLTSHQMNANTANTSSSSSSLANKRNILSAIDALIADQQEQVRVRCQQELYDLQNYNQDQYEERQHARRRSNNNSSRDRERNSNSIGMMSMSMGILGARTPIRSSSTSSSSSSSSSQPSSSSSSNTSSSPFNKPLIAPGTILTRQKSQLTTSAYLTKHNLKNHISIHVGTPHEDLSIANLRLSVFSDYSVNQIEDWVYRSSMIIAQRRMKGAMTITASLNYIDEDSEEVDNWIVGSLECSTHEFIGTELGMSRPPGSILYITEVAVSPKIRRSGTATMLLQALDKLAHSQNIETLYLHVDVQNFPAYTLYERAGFEVVDSHNNPMYAEFTRSLNLHDGATRGRNHYLMQKRVSRKQTWYNHSSSRIMSERSSSSLLPAGKRGRIGFELWDPYLKQKE